VPYLVAFSLFGHFRVGKLKNKEKHLFYFDLRNLFPKQIQLSDIENPRNPKRKTHFLL
jgi:hypothetical protein